jgi:hypothetical protein
MSARRKQETVLRLLRGEDLELVSRELGVIAAELSDTPRSETVAHARAREAGVDIREPPSRPLRSCPCA